MENVSTYEVPPQQYTTVIRQLLSHEDDVTNQRLMWLLVVQGLLINAYIPVRNSRNAGDVICVAGALMTLSAFVSLYKSFQARGYLKYLGMEAKKGKLPENYLRFDGWPMERIQGWRSKVWVSPWFERFSDLLEPYFSIPALLAVMWVFFALKSHIPLLTAGVVAVVGSLLGMFLYCVVWVWFQDRGKEEQPKE